MSLKKVVVSLVFAFALVAIRVSAGQGPLDPLEQFHVDCVGVFNGADTTPQAAASTHWATEGWCGSRDSNPEQRVSETRAYADSASGAFGSTHLHAPTGKPGVQTTKSPGTLRRTRAWWSYQRRLIARRSPPLGARAYPPRMARWAFVAARF